MPENSDRERTGEVFFERLAGGEAAFEASDFFKYSITSLRSNRFERRPAGTKGIERSLTILAKVFAEHLNSFAICSSVSRSIFYSFPIASSATSSG